MSKLTDEELRNMRATARDVCARIPILNPGVIIDLCDEVLAARAADAEGEATFERHEDEKEVYRSLETYRNFVKKAIRNAKASEAGSGGLIRWRIVGDLFDVGCTTAIELCRFAGIDPHEYLAAPMCDTCAEQPETRTMTPDAVLVRNAVCNARPMHPGKHSRSSAVSDTLAVGLTTATELCRRFEKNPDELLEGPVCEYCATTDEGGS